MPCQELFDRQPKEYREKVIEKNSKKISIEASSIFGWEKYVASDGASLGLKVIYIFSHDSIGLGEDGPTHQPIEHLAHLRAIPN